MSSNIGSIKIVASDGFCIPRSKLEALRDKYEGETPESCILEPDESDVEEIRGMLFVNHFAWCGEGSGGSYGLLRNTVLPQFLGSADLVITWGKGDSHSGLRLLNGVVTEHDIALCLGAERKR